VTKCLEPRKNVLGPKQRQIIVSSLQFTVERGDIQLAAFVVMPDHFHVLVGLLEHLTVRRWMHLQMSYIARTTNAFLRSEGCRWQDGYHDTEVRSQKQFNYLVDYIRNNPVEAGLVNYPEEWDATSATGFEWVNLVW
jgi:REP element-mobilizing transposase RayT